MSSQQQQNHKLPVQSQVYLQKKNVHQNPQSNQQYVLKNDSFDPNKFYSSSLLSHQSNCLQMNPSKNVQNSLFDRSVYHHGSFNNSNSHQNQSQNFNEQSQYCDTSFVNNYLMTFNSASNNNLSLNTNDENRRLDYQPNNLPSINTLYNNHYLQPPTTYNQLNPNMDESLSSNTLNPFCNVFNSNLVSHQNPQMKLYSNDEFSIDENHHNSQISHHTNVILQLQDLLPKPPLSKAPTRPDINFSLLQKRGKRKSKFTKSQDELILSLKKKGKSWVEIAEVSGVGSYLAARNRYQVIVGQQGNYNSFVWTAENKVYLQKLLDAGELEKWSFISFDLNKATNKKFSSEECQEIIRFLFWSDPNAFGITENTIVECIKEKKLTEKAIEQNKQNLKKIKKGLKNDFQYLESLLVEDGSSFDNKNIEFQNNPNAFSVCGNYHTNSSTSSIPSLQSTANSSNNYSVSNLSNVFTSPNTSTAATNGTAKFGLGPSNINTLEIKDKIKSSVENNKNNENISVEKNFINNSNQSKLSLTDSFYTDPSRSQPNSFQRNIKNFFFDNNNKKNTVLNEYN